MRPLWGLVVLCTCGGDPRAPFVGSYSGAGTQTWGDGTVDSIKADFTITAPERSYRLQFGNICMFTATAETADTFQFDPISCPTVHGTSLNGVKADFTTTYDTGTGTLTNRSLTVVQQGSQLGSNYADGSPNRTFHFRVNITASKQ